MKSWMSVVLPDDEYKEKQLLYYLAEGAVLQLATIFILYILEVDSSTILFISVILFVMYVFLRYIFSGIEYTDIATNQEYKKELTLIKKKAIISAATFSATFFIVNLFTPVFGEEQGWVNVMGMIFAYAIIFFLVNFISLKRSYGKNKELL